MLKKRIIPVLLISNDLLVKTKKFNSDRVIGNKSLSFQREWY